MRVRDRDVCDAPRVDGGVYVVAPRGGVHQQGVVAADEIGVRRPAGRAGDRNGDAVDSVHAPLLWRRQKNGTGSRDAGRGDRSDQLFRKYTCFRAS